MPRPWAPESPGLQGRGGWAMVEAMSADTQGKKSGAGRKGLLAVLLAVVAVLAAWLNDCIPGLGVGTGRDEGEGEGEAKSAEPAEPAEQAEDVDAKPAEERPSVARVAVSVRGCSLDGGEVVPCAEFCERFGGELAGREQVEIDGDQQAAHADVTAVLDCARSQGVERHSINGQ